MSKDKARAPRPDPRPSPSPAQPLPGAAPALCRSAKVLATHLRGASVPLSAALWIVTATSPA